MCTGESISDIELSAPFVNDIEVLALSAKRHPLDTCGGSVQCFFQYGDEWLMVGLYSHSPSINVVMEFAAHIDGGQELLLNLSIT